MKNDVAGHYAEYGVGYLLGETEQENLLKDPEMLKRLNDIENMKPNEKGHVLFAIDAMIQKIKIKNIAIP